MARRPRKYICNLGDVNALDYGGFIVWQEKGDLPRAMVFDEPEPIVTQHHRVECYTVYFFDIENDVAADLNWLTSEDIARMESSNSLAPGEWRTMATSPDVVTRARAYQEVGLYHGYANMTGSYGEELTRGELTKYHGALLRRAYLEGVHPDHRHRYAR